MLVEHERTRDGRLLAPKQRERLAGRSEEDPQKRTEVLASQPDVQRVVRDRTNLHGRFDIDLEFAPMSTTAGAESGPSLFTAIKEQLGLRLDSQRGPVDVHVIDAIEMPTGN